MPDAAAAARAYGLEVLGVAFDVMLLGLGEDGHIASLFPESDPLTHPASGELPQLVAATKARMPPFVERITLTPPAILNSRDILMIVAGPAKAAAVRAALGGPEDVSRCPAQLLRAAGDRVEWILDQSAAPR
jgi:6-phosphogluconolactonase